MQLDTARFSRDIPNIFERDGSLDLAVAFVTDAGLSLVQPALEQKLAAGLRVRLLLDLQEGATDPAALWGLVALARTYPRSLFLKAYVPEQGILHSKVYISEREDSVTLITGSANLSAAALKANVEHGLKVDGTVSDLVIAETRQEFASLWNSERAFSIDEEAARRYETYAGLRRAAVSRGERRARGSWRDLVKHLSEGPATTFEWPSVGAAFTMGAITARGRLNPEDGVISIPLLFNPGAYKDGQITVREVSRNAAAVLPEIPQTLAAHARQAFPTAEVSRARMTVTIRLQDSPDIFGNVMELFAPETDCNFFRLPRELANAGDSVVTEFVRGFAVASALLTDATSMPRSAITGLPGQMTVWLRPKQGNRRLFNQLYDIITRRLHITAYQHWRENRDPHLKLLCEEFAEIGFGIGWWDELLRAGADYNQSLFPQERLPNPENLP